MMKKIFVLFFVSLLTACGGGSGNSTGDDVSNLPEERPVGKLEITAFDGLIINGDVKIYDFSTGQVGELLGTGKTDGTGQASIDLGVASTPFYGIVEGGYYIEEATGIQVQVDRSQGLRLIFVGMYEQGKAIETVATLFSTVAAGYAEYLINDLGVGVESAIEMAYQQVDAWAGYDTRNVVPLDVSDDANFTPYLTDPHRGGFVAASVSQYTLDISNNAGQSPHDFFTSINFILTAYEDVKSDGKLDGMNDSGSIAFGGDVLSAHTYLELLPVKMLQFVIGDRNNTGLDFDSILPFASRMNEFSENIFGNVFAPNITESEPSISQFLPADGEVLSGTWPASANISDDYGIESVEYYLSGQYVGQGSTETGRLGIDTLNFPNGTYTLSIVVTNFMGNTSTETHNITINNGELSFRAGSASQFSSTTNWNATCPIMNFRVVDTTGLGAEYVKFNENILLLDSDIAGGSMALSSSSSSRCGTITAKDRLGGEYVAYVRSNAVRGDCVRSHRMLCQAWRWHCSYSMSNGC